MNVKRNAWPLAWIVCILGFSGIALAQQQCKVGVVNMLQVVTESNQGKEQSVKFDKRVAEWQARISVIQAAISEAKKKLTSQGPQANPSDVADLNKTITEKSKELVQTLGDAQKDVDDYRDSLLSPLKASAFEIAKTIAAERGMDSVEDSSPSSVSTTSFQIPAGGTDCDISAEVRTRMNAKYNSAINPTPQSKGGL